MQDDDDVFSGQATGVGTEGGEQINDVENLSDDMSDAGWDTDLEIEGSVFQSLIVPTS